jgi:hypothetical protein
MRCRWRCGEDRWDWPQRRRQHRSSNEELARVAFIQMRLDNGAQATHAVQIELRRPEVAKSLRIDGYLGERRRVKGDVMIDKLPEIHMSRWNGWIINLGSSAE